MRKLKIKSISTGAISGMVFAGVLMLNTGTGSAAKALALQTKPAPRPAAPAKPVARPAVPAARPATQPARPAASPTTRPATGVRPAIPQRTPAQPTHPIEKPGDIHKPGPIGKPGPTDKPGPGRDPGHEVGHDPGHTPGHDVPHPGPQRGQGPAFHPDPRGNFGDSKSGLTGHADPRTHRVISMSRNEPDGSHTFVHNSPTGVRHVENVRQEFGHPVRTVGDGHRGYVERDLLRRPGYHERTYFDHGRVRAVVYRDHVYGRFGAYPVYVPAYYYHPAFYAYFGVGWGAGVAFAWGTSPGYVAYSGYFAPPAVYASPNAWVADYVINQNLQANAQAQQDAGADAAASGDAGQAEPQAAPAPIPQDVRDTYTQQVQTTVQDEQAQASGQTPTDDAPGALSPKFRVFQSYSDVEAQNGAQQCALTGGDFVHRDEDTPDANKTVAVTVVAVAVPSASHCTLHAHVRLSVDTLQDWYNNFLQAQQAGMDAAAANQGHNGFPAMTDTAKVANPNGQATPDDPSAVSNAIQQQGAAATAMQAQATGGGQ